jgi:hypothetical protein
LPNIRQLEAPQGTGLSPTETGVEAFAAVGRRVGAFGNQRAELLSQQGSELKSTIGDVGQVANDYMTHRDISAGAATGAQLIANVNDQWNETAKNADPNDVTIKQKFLEEQLSPTLDKFKEGFSTQQSQQWAEHFVDQYRQHMFEKTSSDMSTLAGIAVRKNVATTVNSLSSAVASDPSSLDFALKSVDHSIGATVASSPNMSATDAASVSAEVGLKAKESIVKSAISGMITKNPNINLDAIQKKYGDYINGAEMKMFAAAAVRQDKSDKAQARQDILVQKQLADMQVHTTSNKIVADNVSIDPQTSRPIIKPEFFNQALDIVKKNPGAPSAAATFRTLNEWGEHQQALKTAPVVDDPIAKKDLTDGLFDPDHPTSRLDLMKAQTAGKLSDHTFQSMERLVTELEQSPLKGPVWQDTAAAVKDELILSNVGIPGKDITGAGNYAKWAQTFIPQYLAKSRSGTLPPNALDVKDPNSMISQSMAPFKRTVAQRAQDYVSALGGAPAASGRKVGDVAVPPALGGVAALSYNPGKKLWRDDTTGTVYDSAGSAVH